MTASAAADPSLLKTPLYAWHVAQGAKMVPFAGYDMPVQYPDGVLGEHLHTREAAGLFDVSHMGQAWLVGPNFEATSRALETLVPRDVLGLAPGAIGYTQLLNEKGGILDDLMVTRPADPAAEGRLFLVVNAACKDADFAHIAANLPSEIRLEPLPERALLALQGPKAAECFTRIASGAAGLSFMTATDMDLLGAKAMVSRSGYTGEDGYEISVPAEKAVELADALVAMEEVKPIGLGARDSLRLEAGLCLYGHDIDETTTPIEAGLAWSIARRRREEGGFPGAETLRKQLAEGVTRRRVGLLPDGKAPAREGTEIHDGAGVRVGTITSGGFGPSVGGPIAMGYVATSHAKAGTDLDLLVRGKARPAKVAKMPFVTKRFHKPD